MELPGVEEFERLQLNLPCGWWVGSDEREQIIAAIAAWVQKHG